MSRSENSVGPFSEPVVNIGAFAEDTYALLDLSEVYASLYRYGMFKGLYEYDSNIIGGDTEQDLILDFQLSVLKCAIREEDKINLITVFVAICDEINKGNRDSTAEYILRQDDKINTYLTDGREPPKEIRELDEELNRGIGI